MFNYWIMYLKSKKKKRKNKQTFHSWGKHLFSSFPRLHTTPGTSSPFISLQVTLGPSIRQPVAQGALCSVGRSFPLHVHPSPFRCSKTLHRWLFVPFPSFLTLLFPLLLLTLIYSLPLSPSVLLTHTVAALPPPRPRAQPRPTVDGWIWLEPVGTD